MPRIWSQALNFYKTFSVLHIIGQMSTAKVSRAKSRACGRGPPGEEKNLACGLLPVDVACGLWCVLVGGTHPIFLFLLEGWWNTTNPLAIPAQEFFTLADVGLR